MISYCQKCVYPSTYPGIKFNKDGICDVCLYSLRKWRNRDYGYLELELEKIFRHHRQKKGKYDCVVAFSGGKDSSYTLYLCKKIYKLNVLAVNFDNGFQSKECRQRINSIAEKLDVGLISSKPRWKTLKKIYQIFLKKTGEFCTPCNFGIYSTVYRFALQEKTPLVIFGYSQMLDATPILSERRFCGEELFRNVMRDELPFAEYEEFLLEPLLKKTDFYPLCLPFYIKWDKKQINHVLKKELGWKQGDFGEEHPDCLAFPIASLLKEKRYGFGRYTDEYAALTRHNQVSREKALKDALRKESSPRERA